MDCPTCHRVNLTEQELAMHIKYFHESKPHNHQQSQKVAHGVCPECKSTLWFEEGCTKCNNCGFTKC